MFSSINPFNMKRFLSAISFVTIGISSSVNGIAQAPNLPRPVKHPTRNIVWFTPSRATKINGLAVGLQAFPTDDRTLTINGINMDAGLVNSFALPYVVAYLVSPKNKREQFFTDEDSAQTFVNGLSISMGGESGIAMNGIAVHGIFSGYSTMNGISTTAFMSTCNNFRGIMVSGLHNRAKKGIGIQIALINYCEKLKGFQIGLWNTSGKRSLPFINWGI
jgi:hypothetical protein